MTVVGREMSWAPPGANSVSILVVVDDGRRPGRDRSFLHRDSGFQSLLLWMTVVGPSLALPRQPQASMFQSLLLWMTVVGEVHRSTVRGDGCCFNPCCCG